MTSTSQAAHRVEVDLGALPGVVFEPVGADAGIGVLFLPHRTGTDDFVLSIAERLSDAGLPVLVPDLFFGMSPDLTPEQRKRLVVDDEFITVAAAGVRVLRTRYPEHRGPAALGFCMGGRLAFLAAAAGVGIGRACGFYSGELDRPWHGELSPIQRVRPGIGPIQLHRGTLDDSATPEAENAAAEAVSAVGGYLEAHLYAGALHAFVNHNFPEAYHPEAARRAMASALTFLTDATLDSVTEAMG